jgi:cell division protein FtsI (penicillin-binding protein 3)
MSDDPMSLQAEPIDQRQRKLAAAVLIGVVVCLIALGGRLIHIDTALRPRLVAIASQQQWGSAVVRARRGAILDARGRLVAVSRYRPDVFVDPAQVKNVDQLAAELSARVNLPAARIADRINSRPKSRYVMISSQVDEVTVDAVRTMRSPAVGLTDRVVRTYPIGDSMAHVLGFVGRDGRGLEGLELAYDEHLRGSDGRQASVRDARRRAIWRSPQKYRPPLDGGNIVLTLDAEVQRVTEKALANRVRAFHAESGVAVVMVPKTGDVLAMACVPTFDPNQATSVPASLRRNRVVTDPVEPGSTFKPFIACGALAGGFVTTTEQIDCHQGTYRIGRRTITDSHPHGLMDLKGIITFSSNIGMTIIGQRMGNEALHDTIRRFGFGGLTGIDFPGESAGTVHPLGDWTSYSTVSVSFGYEVGVTPLQLIAAFSAILNDGVLMKPRLVRALLGPDGEIVESFDAPQVAGRATPSDIARYMTEELLVSVVENGGSGRRARLASYQVLGKTGTAKLSLPDRGGYEPGAYLSTFMGSAPAADPQVAVLVMIRRPDAALGYYGSVVSAPAVRDILAETLAYLEVPPDAVALDAG